MNKKSERMPLEELQQTSEFLRLTPKQKLFVQTFVASGLLDGDYDAIAAIQTAYQCKNFESARTMSYRMLQTPSIIEVLNLHFRRSPTEQFLVDVDRAVRNRHVSIAQIQAMRLKAEVQGILTRLPNKTSADNLIPNDVREDAKVARKKHREKENAGKPGPKPRKSDYELEAESLI